MSRELSRRNLLRPASLGILILTALTVAAVLIADPDGALEGVAESEETRHGLSAALESGDRALAAELLEAGADPALAILEATRRDDRASLEWLFDRGVVATGKMGARALLRALRSDDPELAPLLRAHGADLDATDAAGTTLLMSMAGDATNEKWAFRVVRALVVGGADVDRKSHAGRSALFLAVKANRFRVVRALLEVGPEIDPRDRDGWTPLMLAARDGRMPSVAKLLEAGADPNVRSALGWTPLMWASRHGHLRVVNALLEAGADPNQSSYAGGTALIRAVQTGRRHIAWALLRAGARTDAELAGRSASEWARLGGQRQMLTAFERAVRR